MNLIANTFNATINADDADKSNLQHIAGRKTVSIFAILATEKGEGKKFVLILLYDMYFTLILRYTILSFYLIRTVYQWRNNGYLNFSHIIIIPH